MDTGGGTDAAPNQNAIVDARQKGGFDFLGYHFERGYRWPRKKSLEKLKATIREKTKSGRPGKRERHHPGTQSLHDRLV